jgi:AcrR family transcriptional regulator
LESETEFRFILSPVDQQLQPHLRRVPQQARSRALIRRVLDTAEVLLVREGPDALTTTRIAADAGVAVGSLYQYFPDKGAIVEALARRYLDDFEAVMEEQAARAVAERWDDLPVRLIDAFADRYRAQPGYRALWFGRAFTGELREADRRNKHALADGVRRILVDGGLARDGEELRSVCRAAVLAADALLQEAFREDPAGQPALLGEAKRILRLYFADLVGRQARTGEPDDG